LAALGTLSIINNQYQGSLAYISGLTIIMYLFALAFTPTIILSIQGYRHRKKIKASDVPDDIPKNLGVVEIKKVILYVVIIYALRDIFGLAWELLT